MDALIAAMHGTKVTVPVHDPLGRPITAEYGLLPDGSAVIETAAASGLTLLKPEERMPACIDLWNRRADPSCSETWG